MNQILSIIIIALTPVLSSAQNPEVISPDSGIRVELFNTNNDNTGEWYLNIYSGKNDQTSETTPQIKLGISRSDQDFSKNLKFLKAGKTNSINEKYTSLHGKRSQRSNSANEKVLSFENSNKAKMNVIVRVYNVEVKVLRRGGFAAVLQPIQ